MTIPAPATHRVIPQVAPIAPVPSLPLLPPVPSVAMVAPVPSFWITPRVMPPMPHRVMPYHTIRYHTLPCVTLRHHASPYDTLPYVALPYVTIRCTSCSVWGGRGVGLPLHDTRANFRMSKCVHQRSPPFRCLFHHCLFFIDIFFRISFSFFSGRFVHHSFIASDIANFCSDDIGMCDRGLIRSR